MFHPLSHSGYIINVIDKDTLHLTEIMYSSFLTFGIYCSAYTEGDIACDKDFF